MSLLTETVKHGDWKNEKHVPEIKANFEGGIVDVDVAVGSEIEHPNTLEHHIAWIKVFFLPEGGAAPIEVGSYEFNAHGESDVFAKPEVHVSFKSEKKGSVFALSMCNIHGLWENAVEL
ncbi:MAG: desulfoferrodoxin family protein [Peptoniphilus sp.]|nr:desulfoferrodoxin family protein [Peptoniphilus sp.]MDD7362584.1 desulfoferrodoxin family protein [Bacillota bacterium]MDY6045017.1 desulfoferrodoxin family protein [Peptoniphilus sp.]